jgi:prepilin-type N-terminal cleavage/methylation domain-containing protein
MVSRDSNQNGFSVVELLVVLAIGSVVLAITFGAFQSLNDTMQGDADMRIVEWQLKLARETAINQRRAVEVRFVSPNVITLVRDNLPAGTTVLSTTYLQHNAKFMLFTGQPDTPDSFGRAAAVYFGAAAKVMFTADGMFTDAAGNPVNGSVFIGQITRPGTSRALTVFGPTARIRAYRWNGTAWRP